MAVASLGCGTYEVYFKIRGGYRNVCRARNITQLSYARVLNEISEASITIALAGQDAECCECIGSINPWEHEISIYRDGVEVWCGPIVNGSIDLDGMTATFQARDLMAWTEKRWIELIDSDYDVEDIELALVFDWALRHAYVKDPWNMEWALGSTGIPITQFYPAYYAPERWGGNYPKVSDELRTLSKAGCDFTVVRRMLIGGDLEINPPVLLPKMYDNFWAKLPTLEIVGQSMATEVAVAGGGGGYYGWSDDQMWIERPYDEYRQRFGLLQEIYVESTLDEEDTLGLPNAITQEAYNLRELKKEPYVYIKGGELAQKAPVNFDQLIPGARVQVALLQTCRTIDTEYRLLQVNVTYSAKGETVSVQLTPLGAEAIRG